MGWAKSSTRDDSIPFIKIQVESSFQVADHICTFYMAKNEIFPVSLPWIWLPWRIVTVQRLDGYFKEMSFSWKRHSSMQSFLDAMVQQRYRLQQCEDWSEAIILLDNAVLSRKPRINSVLKISDCHSSNQIIDINTRIIVHSCRLYDYGPTLI